MPHIRLCDGRSDPDLAYELMKNDASERDKKLTFNVDSKESGVAAALCRLVTENSAEGLERLCAVFFMSTDPLALMLATYEALQSAARKQRLRDLHLAQVGGLPMVPSYGSFVWLLRMVPSYGSCILFLRMAPI